MKFFLHNINANEDSVMNFQESLIVLFEIWEYRTQVKMLEVQIILSITPVYSHCIQKYQQQA